MALRSTPAPNGRRTPVNLKMREELRDMLAASAAATGRTLSSEIEARLAASFEQAGPDQGEHLPLISAFARMLSEVEEETGQAVTDENGIEAQRLARRAFDRLADTLFGEDRGSPQQHVAPPPEGWTWYDPAPSIVYQALKSAGLMVRDEGAGGWTFVAYLNAIWRRKHSQS